MPGFASAAPAGSSNPSKRKKTHRGGRGKKRRDRRKSFAVPTDTQDEEGTSTIVADGQSFYSQGRNLSGTSLDSEALLDHRDQPHFIRARRSSAVASPSVAQQASQSNTRLMTLHDASAGEEDEEPAAEERTPLLSVSARKRPVPGMAFKGFSSTDAGKDRTSSQRESSRASGKKDFNNPFTTGDDDRYDVNYPPSMPGTPKISAMDRDMRFEDAMLMDEIDELGSPRHTDSFNEDLFRSPSSPKTSSPFERRKTFDFQAEGDVCFPQEGMSEMAEEDLREIRGQRMRSRRRRKRWPELSFLEEWSHLEKEGRSEERRAKKITEPQLINGRLRPVYKGWYQPEEDAPYRFTYFNEEFETTVHSSTISELVQPGGQGGSFRELFKPDRPILSDSSDSESDDDDAQPHDFSTRRALNGQTLDHRLSTRHTSILGTAQGGSDMPRDGIRSPKAGQEGSRNSRQGSGQATPSGTRSAASPVPAKEEKPVRYGERPIWWLDVMSPTEAEMRALRRTFGIHPLTTEDIMLREAREKVELFRNYYFVNYRTFDQDPTSENYLEPIDMYVVVFREGVLSFHFSPTPHPANVRRRIRMLRDYMTFSSDWISYAIIDDITDVYVPLIQSIEEEVDEIDAAIVRLHSDEDPMGMEMSASDRAPPRDTSKSDAGGTVVGSGGDLLRRVSECRTKVMSLYRLLGNKADVIKGFAKRCNEQYEIAPRSEIGVFLGDIQDHIVTMTGNLSHYEMMLARSQQNYLAQINIRMNERAEKTNDVLGKLTVLGTIVLPMNIITGLWGMNVWVPGQDYEGNLTWFWCITAGLVMFGLACFLIAKRVYRIV